MFAKFDIPAAVAVTVTMGFFLLIALLTFVEIPKENHDIVTLVTGVLGTALGTVVNFYFGSSKSSQTKDETIQQIAKGTGS